jgi:hypothetical protein
MRRSRRKLSRAELAAKVDPVFRDQVATQQTPDFFARAMLCVVVAAATGKTPIEIAYERYPDDEATQEIVRRSCETPP